MIGIPGTYIPQRTLPMQDLTVCAASVTSPADGAVLTRFSIDLFCLAREAFGPEMFDPMQIRLVSDHGGQELGHPERIPRDRRQTTSLIQIIP